MRFSDDQLDVLQDGINEEKNARAAARGCECLGRGCPECDDDDETEEEKQDECEE
jgi:hypothetical protein